jgi:hypothetical protein
MSEEKRASDPGALWRDQPQEEVAVELSQIVNRRAEALSASTRSEILMSIGAAVLFIAVMAWRFGRVDSRLFQWGFVAVAAWVGISLYRFRRWSAQDRPRVDAVASAGIEYYRHELERRRDHLRNEWVWHGPLLLACFMLIAIVAGRAYPGMARLWSVLPLIVVLLAWTVFGFIRRLRLAKALQAEIDELAGK